MKTIGAERSFLVVEVQTYPSTYDFGLEEHKLWTAILNQMGLINESIDEAIADLSNQKTTTKACVGLKIQVIMTNLKTRLKYYRTQRVSYYRKRNNRDYVNAKDCFSVGTALQKELDGKSFIDKQKVSS